MRLSALLGRNGCQCFPKRTHHACMMNDPSSRLLAFVPHNAGLQADVRLGQAGDASHDPEPSNMPGPCSPFPSWSSCAALSELNG